MLVAAIDQGSSSTKGAVVDSRGGRLDELSLPISTKSSGRSVRHQPREIEASIRSILARLIESHPVAAVGLTCQRSTCLVWDRESGEPLTEALSWQDTSQHARVESLGEHAAVVERLTGLRLSPHYAGAKLAALLEELPDGMQRGQAGEIVAGTLDAWLVRQLTGLDSTEPGHAGRTLLFDLENGQWSPQLADLFGVPLAALPPVAESAGLRGQFLGIPVTATAGDQQAALIGHGGWDEGVTAVHFGTGAFVLSGTGKAPLRLAGALSAAIATAAGETRFQIEASVNSAGSAVDWARRTTGASLDDWRTRTINPDELPRVFPAFRGTGAPWWRPDAHAVVAGIDQSADGDALVGGTIAGVAMRVLDCVELLASAVAVRRLRVSGKLTRLDGLVGLLADASGLPVDVASDEEVGLLGVARLAEAGLAATTEHMGAAPPLAAERQPRWPAAKASEARSRWRSFAESALELSSSA